MKQLSTTHIHMESSWSQIRRKGHTKRKKKKESNFKIFYINNTENSNVNKNKKVTRRQQFNEKN